MEAGAHGAPMDRAVVHVEQKAELDPVTVHSHNMEVKPVQDKPQRLLAVTRIHVKVSLRSNKGSAQSEKIRTKNLKCEKAPQSFSHLILINSDLSHSFLDFI